MKTYHIIVKGRVQGVWYRASTKQQAEQLQLKGWVRNLEDGNVEVMASGEQSILDTFVKWLWQGPMLAKVTEVDIKEIKAESFDDFAVR